MLRRQRVKKETTTFQTSCTVEFFERLEQYCKNTATSRSALIRLALEKEIAERQKNG